MTTLAINTFQPTLSSSDIKKIAKQVKLDIDVNNEVYKTERYKCANGIEIEIQVSYNGFDYRNIHLSYLEVYHGETSLEDLKDALWLEIDEVVDNLNDTAEREYENEKEYERDLIFG